eukprot:CAMPEP_0171575878 /NCGR_PEP_ID=MMETSP0961-20121227/6262_1 /TAXON_ID=87120 /ORGANISM="Aurantiochytrium limacinum, Strain ATCCMYA-1381" /LENGTH=299 /DNA_ID=CAMNT_0012131563 /DNA_START=303 /DNA_END=1202 /DNA_ORIENTATION=-
MSKNARPQPNTTETVPTSVQDIESNTPHSDYADSGSLCLTLKGDKDVKIDSSQPSTSCSLDSAKDGQHAPLCSQLNAAPTSTRAAKRTCSSPNDQHPNPSAWKMARTRSNSMETLPDSIGDHLINCDVNWQTVDGACLCDSPMRDATDAANAADEIAELTYDLHAAVEPAELSFDPELGDAAANEIAEDPPDEIGELLSGSSQWENVSFPCLHDAVRTSPENGTNQARIHAYEAPFYYTLRCELRKALISVEVEPSHGGGLILSDGVLEDSMLWIAGSGAAPQISMQQEEHRILSEKKS